MCRYSPLTALPWSKVVLYIGNFGRKPDHPGTHSGQSQTTGCSYIREWFCGSDKIPVSTMCVEYYYGVALLALLAVSRVTAAPTTEPPTEEDCGKLVKPLPADKFNTVFGEWILIEAFSDDEGYAEKLKMGKSSKVELRATSSDKSVLFKQGNMIDDTCVNYSIMNMSIVENTIQRLKDNGISKAHFLQACPDCLVMHFSNTITVAGVPIRMVRSFYIFGKTGKLHESELEPIRKQAECLKFPQPAQFIYDGVAEFCPETKKSETK